jgi:cellulose biosynthesis protein BcsQ
MTAKIFSVSNMKGGVGKTTIAVTLAHEFARRGDGARVLLIDLDPQANASFWLCRDERLTQLIENGRTVEAFLEDSIIFDKMLSLQDFAEEVPGHPSGRPIHVIASSPELRIIERQLIVFLARRGRNLFEVERVVSDLLDREIQMLREAYDIILFDSAPGISALTEAALRSSQVILVPTVPDFISNLGLEAFCKTVCWSHKNGDKPKRPWVIANMVKHTPHQDLMLRAMRAEAQSSDGGFYMFDVEIPEATWIEEAVNSINMDELPPIESSPFAKLADEALRAASASK